MNDLPRDKARKIIQEIGVRAPGMAQPYQGRAAQGV